MKIIKNIIAVLLCAFLLLGCSDEDKKLQKQIDDLQEELEEMREEKDEKEDTKDVTGYSSDVPDESLVETAVIPKDEVADTEQVITTEEKKEPVEPTDGVIVYDDGSRFEGTVLNGERLEGKYYFANGDVYTGTFKNGLMYKGTYTYANGASVTGTYDADAGQFISEEKPAEQTVAATEKAEPKDEPFSEESIEGYPDVDVPTYDFITDLSAYEQYMCPKDVDGYLILANRENPLSEDYAPENLVPITNVRKDGRSEQMVETAEKALQALYIEMCAAGYTDVSVTSGYRTYAKQKYLYSIYTENEMNAHPDWSRARAEQEVDTYSARPGTSEHQTGLCVDMHNLSSASQAFEKKEVYTWLINNCYKFGFVLRFPEGKEDITGYSFEPWHYRFVGRYHASEMHRLDMCLEEYLEYLG